MIKEIQNFRQKYPQYEDMDDVTLANQLATKYPEAYGDLPDLVKKETPGKKGTFRTEVVGPVLKGASALAFDIPRTTLEIEIARGTPGAQQAYDFLYPEQVTGLGKALNIAGQVGGTLAGGAGKVAGAVFKGAGKKLGIEALKKGTKLGFKRGTKRLAKKALQGAATGAAFEAATAKPTQEEYLKGVETGAKFGGIFPVGLAALGKAGKTVGGAVSKTGQYLSEQVGGITKATKKTIERLGPARVFDSVKSQANYIGQVLVPKAQQKISSSINKFTKGVEEVATKQLRVPQSVVNDIKKWGSNAIYKTADTYGKTTQGVIDNIEVAMQTKEEAAHKAYRAAVNAFKGPAMKADTFFRTMKSGLVKKGWITLRGQPTTRYKNGLNSTYDKMTDLFLEMNRQGTAKKGKILGKVLSKEDFSTYRDLLWDMLKERPSDILVNKIRNALYKSAQASGMKGLQAARKAEKKVFEITKDFYNTRGELKSLLSERTLKKFYQMPKPKVEKIKQLEKYTGIKIIEDIKKINAAQFLDDMQTQLTDPRKLESHLHATGSPKNSVLRGQFKRLLGQDLMDDLDAHFANRDFNLVTDVPGTGGTIYPSKAGIIRSAVADASKKYYEKVKPTMQRMGEGFKKGVKEPVKKYYTEEPLKLGPKGKKLLGGIQPGLSIKDVSKNKGFLKKHLTYLENIKKTPAYKNDASYKKQVDLAIAGIREELNPSKMLPYTGEKELTTKVLNQLRGKTKVSKQFISDLTNQPQLKQSERDTIRKVLDEFGDDIPVKEFANKVKTQLLPIEPTSNVLGRSAAKAGKLDKYEYINLPSDKRGKVMNYFETIHESPIPTSGADAHYSKRYFPNYFAHTRKEDIWRSLKGKGGKTVNTPDTRRILELQSDLFQKGNLTRENPAIARITQGEKVLYKGKPYKIELYDYGGDQFGMYSLKKGKEGARKVVKASKILKENPALKKKIEAGREMVEKLNPYRNTWHERVIREEIKQASKDKMKKLRFPTGKTAMEVEGLSSDNFTAWSWMDKKRKVHDVAKNLKLLKRGVTLENRASGEEWIVTDIGQRGSFKAINRARAMEVLFESDDDFAEYIYNNYPKLGSEEYIEEYITDFRPGMLPFKTRTATEPGNMPREFEDKLLDIVDAVSENAENFNVFPETDTSNPIYKFYEKSVQKYLKRIAPDMKQITDPQGVTWFEINVPKEAATAPVEAFAGGGAPLLMLKGKKNEKKAR